MKKKLLTVLLAVVMVFGVFGLTACGAGTNPDEEYNYYGTKYSLEGDVKIEAATYQAVYRMFTTAGSFLLYVDSEGDGAASRFQAINTLAQEWDVTIYHFNPDLTGGYDTTVSANIIETLPATVAGSDIETVQKNLLAISNTKTIDSLKDESLWAIKGKAPTATLSEDEESATLVYNGSIAKMSDDKTSAAAVIASIATKKPSYAQYADGTNVNVPEAFNTSNINTMNLFADNRLHMYNDDGTDAFLDEKTDVYVTVANYAQFAHLMDNNDGYFAVFFGGTWCPNTQAIAMLTNDLAKDYGISKIYMFDPRLDNGVRAIWKATVEEAEDGTKSAVASMANSDYLASNLNSRNDDVNTLMLKNARTMLKNAKVSYEDDATIDELATLVLNNKATIAAYEKDGDKPYEDYANVTSVNDVKGILDNVYNYAHVYAKFLNKYLPASVYESEWNYGTTLTIGGEKYTKMCVPNIMMFNGEGEGVAKLVALAEAEYNYPNTSVEGTAENVEWINAVKAVFDTNPYAYYAPLPDAVEETEDTASDSGSSTSSGTTSGSTGGAAAGGC